jgi:hypothetical protein
MGLTRRFFVQLAKDLRDAKPQTGDDSTEVAIWAHCVTITANAMSLQNGMFNHAKFYEAAGMPEDAIAKATR